MWNCESGTTSIISVASPSTAALRFRRLVRHLHQLGPYALGAFLGELGRVHSLEREIGGMLEEYSQINPALVDVCGGRDWAPPVLWAVR